ncbi:hypothetical protein C4J93_3485 [Pseudomonas sp. R2-37-08W]|nr:hypothetical protein C4J93_3485 [Pseudomonas sp. R2-37-08W]
MALDAAQQLFKNYAKNSPFFHTIIPNKIPYNYELLLAFTLLTVNEPDIL